MCGFPFDISFQCFITTFAVVDWCLFNRFLFHDVSLPKTFIKSSFRIQDDLPLGRPSILKILIFHFNTVLLWVNNKSVSSRYSPLRRFNVVALTQSFCSSSYHGVICHVNGDRAYNLSPTTGSLYRKTGESQAFGLNLSL